MSFDDAMQNAMPVWFGDTFADTVTLNGESVPALIDERAVEANADARVSYIDVELRTADYPAVVYRTDTLVYGGVTWSRPKLLGRDAYTVTVRFFANPEPVPGRAV